MRLGLCTITSPERLRSVLTPEASATSRSPEVVKLSVFEFFKCCDKRLKASIA